MMKAKVERLRMRAWREEASLTFEVRKAAAERLPRPNKGCLGSASRRSRARQQLGFFFGITIHICATRNLGTKSVMAKGKQPKPKAVPNKHLHSRTSYLYQAANYLASRRATASIQSSSQQNPKAGVEVSSGNNITGQKDIYSSKENRRLGESGLPNHLISHMLGVSRKAQIHLSPEIKHTVCKRCNGVLVTGSTSSARVENLSRNSKKSWADVLVVKCLSCEADKRFPIGAQRQKKKADRTRMDVEMTEKPDD